MTSIEASTHITVDPANPGQFFACCGLLELADRLWDGAEGWFGPGAFSVSAGGGLPDLIRTLSRADLLQLDPDDDTASPIEIGPLIRTLRLDWGRDTHAGGK